MRSRNSPPTAPAATPASLPIPSSTVDFSGTSGPSGNTQITAGSIEGAGTYFLGSNQLTVGSNNLSTTVSGEIQDGGSFGGSGASLVKVGTGTLTLSGNNSYTGATTISAGTLVAASSTALPGQTALAVNLGATLTIADGVGTQIGSLADGSSGGGTVIIGPTNPTTLLTIAAGSTTTFSGSFSGEGSIELDNGLLILTGASNGGNIGSIGGTLSLCNCDNGGVTISGGSFTVGGSVEVESGTLAVTNGGSLHTTDIGIAGNMIVTGARSTVTASGVTVVGFFGPGAITIANGGVFNSQGGAEIDTFVPELGIPSVLVTGAGSTWNVGGPALFVGNGTSGGPGMLTVANGGSVNSSAPITIDDVTGISSVTVTGAGSVLNALNSLSIGGTGCGCGPLLGTLTIADGGVVNSPGSTTITTGSTLNLGTGGLAGAIVTPAIANNGQIVANFTDTLTLAAAISGPGTLSKAGSGALVLTGNSTYTGGTTISGGTLVVNGSIANSAVTVNVGGRLAGTGTVGATTIVSGGTLAPGNSPGTLTVQGNLAFQSGALYLVQINSSTASSTNVTGSANLAGTVQALLSGSVSRAYTILHAAGGFGGTTFAEVSGNLPGFSKSLSYTSTDVVLNLAAALGTGIALNQNQQNVANAINNFFNNGGALPANFLPIFNLTGGNLANALTLLSGEAATGGQQAAFQLTNQFLGIMLDPFVDGRSGSAGTGGAALGFAPEREELPDDIALAYSKILKAPPKPATFDQRWSVWGAGYGGSNRTSGDPPIVGSHDLAARTAGGAAGLDYRLAPGTVVALRSPAAAPIGRWRRGSAAARAMRSKPASTARRDGARPMSRLRSPSPITGCRPTASLSPATISPRASTPRASADGWRAAIAL